jgi:hypothetical protein
MIPQSEHPAEDIKNLIESDTVPEVLHTVVVNFKTVDDAIGTYVDKRDMLRIIHRENEAKEQTLKDELDAISMWLREKADEIGVDSFKSPHGTAYRSLKESYRVADWDGFVKWMISTGNTQCVEKRPAKNAVREIHRADKEVPPGLDYVTEVEFNVLRPKKSKSEE